MNFTLGRYVLYILASSHRYVAQYSKHNKASKETGHAVDGTREEYISKAFNKKTAMIESSSPGKNPTYLPSSTVNKQISSFQI